MNETEELLYNFEVELSNLYNGSPVRKEQVQLALDVGNFLFNSRKKFLFIDAPVGTGKTMGVLIPALMYSRKKFKSILYATATISLQNQIMTEEVPKLRRMNLVDDAILAMGKTNYTCRWNFENNQFRFSEDKREILNAYFRNFFEHTGQLSEIENKLELSLKENNYLRMQQIDSNAKGKQCRECIYKEQCSSVRHRKLYRSEKHNFDITVTNHDQMLVSQKFLEAGQNPIVPMNKGVVIVDEAHLFIENYLGRTQEELAFNELLYLIEKIDDKLNKKIRIEQKRILKRADELQGVSELSENIYQLLIESMDKIRNLSIRESMKAKSNDELIDRIDKCERSLKKIISNRYISWIDLESRKYCAASKEFLPEFSKFISNLASFNKVIFMSGTLTGTKKREEIVTQWGVTDKDMEFYYYNTPFDYTRQAKIYIPTDIEAPNHEDHKHLNDVSARIQRITEISKGNLLILCTSKHYMFTISKDLKACYEGKYDILTQGDKSVEMLTKEFKTGNKILVGSGSFFTGFSVTGEALTSVIITKLPFPTPDNPLVKLIGQNMDEESKFNLVILPMMFNKLYQALGRLIRDIGDYGIISILDPRIHSSSKFGDKVLFNLSDLKYDMSDSLLEIYKFYEEVRQNGTKAEFVPYNRNKLLRLPIIDEKSKYRENVSQFLKDLGRTKAEEKVKIKRRYIKQKSDKELDDERIRKERILRTEIEWQESEKQRNEIRESIKPLEEFRKKWGLQLFTQNQRDQGSEKCFFMTVELIRKKVEFDSENVIDDLFKEFPFSNKSEEESYRQKLDEIS